MIRRLARTGPDELIYWEASREAALTLEPSFVPVDHAIVGIVDDFDVPGAPGSWREEAS